MELLLQNHSSYPRIADNPAGQRLRRAHAARARGEISAAELKLAEHAQIDEIVHEQEKAGIDTITDGMVCWADPISHIMGALDGVRINGLLRFFDTNFYYRQPVIVGPLRRRGRILCEDFVMGRFASWLRLKPVLTGPYTLARHCVIESGPYPSVAALALALGELLAAEIRDLVKRGAQFIQVDEPSILSHPSDFRLLRDALEPMWEACRGDGSGQMQVATYFADADELYAQLNSLPADILGVDCAYSPKVIDTIAHAGAAKILALGVVDGRNTRMQSAKATAVRVESIFRRYPHDILHLMPSCGLEYLPRDSARAKLELLGDIRAMIRVPR